MGEWRLFPFRSDLSTAGSFCVSSVSASFGVNRHNVPGSRHPTCILRVLSSRVDYLVLTSIPGVSAPMISSGLSGEDASKGATTR